VPRCESHVSDFNFVCSILNIPDEWLITLEFKEKVLLIGLNALWELMHLQTFVLMFKQSWREDEGVEVSTYMVVYPISYDLAYSFLLANRVFFFLYLDFV
jgi:hypothetical protein